MEEKWLEYLDPMKDKYATFKGSKLISHGHASIGEWYERNWKMMDCSFNQEYCFKLQFADGRIVNILDLDGDEDREYVANTIEEAISGYDYIMNYSKLLNQEPEIELLVVLISNNKVYAIKSLKKP